MKTRPISCVENKLLLKGIRLKPEKAKSKQKSADEQVLNRLIRLKNFLNYTLGKLAIIGARLPFMYWRDPHATVRLHLDRLICRKRIGFKRLRIFF